jgi:hypothetical protein
VPLENCGCLGSKARVRDATKLRPFNPQELPNLVNAPLLRLAGTWQTFEVRPLHEQPACRGDVSAADVVEGHREVRVAAT